MPESLCECGCGELAPIATKTNRKNGRIKGSPSRFISGHNRQFGHRADALTFGRLQHGHSRKGFETVEYAAYKRAKGRCLNPGDAGFANYGGRGIEFRFSSFEQFYRELGNRPSGRSLDRINNSGHYEPGNVRWATRAQQNSNRRPFSEWKGSTNGRT